MRDAVPSHTAVITVAEVVPPALGKKMGRVKATDGTTYWGWASELSLYHVNETFKIGYKLGGDNGDLRSLVGTPVASKNSHPAPSNGSGPEKGMIIKESVALLAAGKTPNQILGYFRAAEEIYHRLKSPEAEDPSDSLDDTF